MQACIVIGGKNKDDQGILAVAKALSKGLESQEVKALKSKRWY